MLNAVEESSSTPPNQSNAGGTLQQPRNDLQPTGDDAASTQTGSPQTVPQVSQDQLRADELRVGDSAKTIQNTTSTPPNFFVRHDYWNAAWLWMIVPIILAILLFRPRKAADSSKVGRTAVQPSDVGSTAREELSPQEAQPASSQKVATLTPKPKKAKKKKAKAKKR
jgi:hypothetical protein